MNLLPNHGKYQWLDILYNLVLTQHPKTIVEIGPGKGYTTITMALALKEIGEGKIHSYDIWDDQYWGGYEDCISEFKKWDVTEYITLERLDFYDWIKRDERTFDLLYLDINNDGEKILEVYEATKDEIEQGSVIIFEGGSVVRDQVGWMHDKVKMNDIKKQVGYQVLTENIKYSASIICDPSTYQLEL